MAAGWLFFFGGVLFLIGALFAFRTAHATNVGQYILLKNAETGGNLMIEVVDTSGRQMSSPTKDNAIWKVRVGYERGPFLLGSHRWEHADDGPSSQGKGREANQEFMR